MFFYALIETAQFVDLLVHLLIHVEIHIAKVLLQSPELAGLSFTPFLARDHIGQLNIKDILQLHAVVVVESTVVHPPVEKNLGYVRRAKDVEDGLQRGAWKASNVDDVGTDGRRAGCP